jgi:uncharacterized protein involved in exopolysaccharide biosynthesis
MIDARNDESTEAAPKESKVLLDLDGLSNGVWRQRKGIGLYLLAGLVAGIVWAIISRPLYEVEVVTVPVDAETAGSASLLESFGLSDLVSMASIGQVSRKQEAIATLNSRSFLLSVVSDLDLMPHLFGEDESPTWKKMLGIGSPATMGDAVDLLRDDIVGVTDDRRSGLVLLRVRWGDRHQSVVWANELVARVNKEMQTRAINRATRELEYLQDELARTESVEVRQAVFRLLEAQLKNLMLANVSDDFALRVLDPALLPDEDKSVNLSKKARIVLGLLAGMLLAFFFLVRKEVRILVK